MRLRTVLPLVSALLAGLTPVVHAATVVHDEHFVPDAVLVITEGSTKQSCVPEKEILLVNGTSPGPKLTFTEGKTVWIRVYNDVETQNLTMHWHGLTMATAPFSDGTPQAAQWPIPPNCFFDYELHVPIGMAGTYFYHSHIGFQAISATGPLIVEEADAPPYLYHDDRTFFFQDVFPDSDKFIEDALLAVPMAYEKAQTIVLINGKGGGRDDDGTPCNESLSVINVEPGKRYRFRFIGATVLSYNILAFEGHDSYQLIEADAGYTEPHNVSFIQIAPGQRYSVLFDTLENPEKQFYYIQLEAREFGGITQTFAVLNYGPPSTPSKPLTVYPPATAPLTLPATDPYWLEYELTPYVHPTTGYQANPPDLFCTTAAEVTRRVNITVHLNVTKEGQLTYLLNNYTWNEGVVAKPYLVALYENDQSEWPNITRALEYDGLDPVTRAFPAEIGECLEIVVQATGSDGNNLESHPWHAHGRHYYDIGSGPGIYNRTANELKWANSTGKPIKRDTTNLWKYGGSAPKGELSGWRAWRLPITQPGVWMIHCHLIPHMVWGMQTAWVMGNRTEVLGKVDYPDVVGYLNYGGDVYGNETHWPAIVNYFNLTQWSSDGRKPDGGKPIGVN